MKFIVLAAYLILFTTGFCQKEIHHIHHFPNGKISTISYIEDSKEGKAIAYNFDGEVIYERHVRRIHGSASVTFTHHANGMVHKATYSSHPDGGIQWYKSYTEFSDKGIIIHEFEDNYDDGPGKVIPSIYKHPNPTNQQPNKETEAPALPKQEVAVCASIHHNSVEIINHSKSSIRIIFYHQKDTTNLLLQKGEKAVGPNYISAEISSPVKDNMRIEITPLRKRSNIIILIESNTFEQYKTKHVIHLIESSRRISN